MKHLILSLTMGLCACASPRPAPQVELSASDWVPFDFPSCEHIFLRGTVNGHAADIVFDSGAEVSLIDVGFAERIGVEVGGRSHVTGTAGTAEGSVAHDLEITVGNMTLRLPRAAVVDFGPFELVSGRPTAVVLGAEVFMQSVVDIDYANRRLAFRDAAKFRYDGPGSATDLRPLKSGRHAIKASIEEGSGAWFLIDTGSGSSLSVYPALAKDQRLLENRAPLSEWISLGIGGIIRETTASIASLSLAGFELEDVPVSIPGDPGGLLKDSPFDGVLGNEILSRFRVIFDFGRDRAFLELAPEQQAVVFTRNMVGLAAQPTGTGLLVIFVAPGSPALAAGWRPGMTVGSVNGVAGTDVELSAELRRLSRAQPGVYLPMVDGDGLERGVVRARFD